MTATSVQNKRSGFESLLIYIHDIKSYKNMLITIQYVDIEYQTTKTINNDMVKVNVATTDDFHKLINEFEVVLNHSVRNN